MFLMLQRKNVVLGNDYLVTTSTAMWGIVFVTQDIYSDLHDAVIMWLSLLPWLQACSRTAGSSVGGALKAGLQQQRGRRRDLGAVSFKYFGEVYFFLKTPDCSFKFKDHL